MEELSLPELTTEQVEELCSIAEKAAREYILSRVPPKRVETLSISVETEGEKPLTLTVEVELILSPFIKNYGAQNLADGAVKEAFASVEKYLRELSCHLQK
ncbi:MAG: DUF3194 domain-containing protein [Candidatus Bathyarchaeia archaeon]